MQAAADLATDVTARLASGLRPVREPALTTADLVSDALLAFALGLAAALLLAFLVRLVLTRRTTRRETLDAELAAARLLPPGERLLALARLARRMGVDKAGLPGFSEALYRPHPDFEPDMAEAVLRRAQGRS